LNTLLKLKDTCKIMCQTIHLPLTRFTNLAALTTALLVWLPQAGLSDEAATREPSEYTQDESVLSVLPVDGINSASPHPENTQATLDEALIFLSPDERRSLIEIGELLQFHPSQMDTQLLPDTPLSASIGKQMGEADLNIGIEMLRFMCNSWFPSAYRNAPINERQLTLYNILRSISTLQGLTYYSASRDEFRTLFEESWAIASLRKSREALPDPIVDDIIPLDTILIHQKDKSFGNNQSKVTYRVVGRDMSIAIENLTPMRYKGLVRVVNPGNMQIRIIVIPVQEGLLVYGAMAAETLNVKSFLKRAQSSFTNRIIAITQWYLSRINEEFQE